MKLTSRIKKGRAKFFVRIRTFHTPSTMQAVQRLNAMFDSRDAALPIRQANRVGMTHLASFQ